VGRGAFAHWPEINQTRGFINQTRDQISDDESVAKEDATRLKPQQGSHLLANLGYVGGSTILSVTIPTRNRAGRLELALRSLARQSLCVANARAEPIRRAFFDPPPDGRAHWDIEQPGIRSLVCASASVSAHPTSRDSPTVPPALPKYTGNPVTNHPPRPLSFGGADSFALDYSPRFFNFPWHLDALLLSVALECMTSNVSR
jgi:hypothetical protein